MESRFKKTIRVSLDQSFIIIFLIISTILMWHYRGGGRDLNLYIVAGSKILNGENPYADSEYANSPLGAVLIYSFSLLVSHHVFPYMIQFLNILGILFFAVYISKVHFNQYNFGLSLIACVLSTPYRALIANVQVTGIILGLFVVSVKLCRSKNFYKEFLGFCFIGIALEIKPQIALPFAVYVFIKNWKTKSFLMFSMFFIVLHFLLDLFYGAILEILWIDKIKAFSDKSFISGPEISLWKFLVSFLDSNEVIQTLTFFAMVVFYVMLFSSIRANSPYVLTIISFAPMLSSYTHMYDLIPFIILIGVRSIFSVNFKILALTVLIVPPQINFFNFGSIVVICLLACGAFVILRKTLRLKSLWCSLAYSILVLFLSYSYSAGDIELELSARLIFLIPLLILELRRISNLEGWRISSRSE